ncbi:MAG: DUF433 domain-containing protein [Planctomycetales bacterium]|nr:DUF433 domain-containing protein [Planctomycetales bacterium]
MAAARGHGKSRIAGREPRPLRESPPGEAFVASDWRPRIAVHPGVLVGKPVIRGTRLSVEFILGLLAEGWTQDQVLDQYPGLKAEDIRACLAYAREVLSAETVYPVKP